MKTILNRYIIFGTLLYLILMSLGYSTWQNSMSAQFFNIYSFVSFAIILTLGITGRIKAKESNLWWTIFLYSLVSVSILNIIYYYHHGSFFGFQAMDENTYHYFSTQVQGLSFSDSLEYFSRYFYFDDYGALFYVSTLYRIIEHPLFVNLINIILAAFSSIYLFRIAQKLMLKKYAFIAALSLYTTAFMICFASTVLKETAFVFIVILTVYHTLNFLKDKRKKSLVWGILFGSLILFFRPAVLAMLIASFGISVLLDRQSNIIRNAIVATVFFGLFIYLLPQLNRMTETFTSFDKSVSIRRNEFKKKNTSEQTAIYASILSSVIGPLPNLIAREEKEANSTYASGLLFKTLISIPFWWGVILVFRKRLSNYYPLVIMSLMGLGSLVYIMEAYELRYHLTYLPFFFVIAFAYLSYQDVSAIKRNNVILNWGYLVVIVILLVWNIRLI